MAACIVAAAYSGYHWWRARGPNVLLVVVDTLRADRLGCYGNQRGLTPFLDELAAKGTVFHNAYAASSWTCPSVASLFTSRFPSQHHVTSFESVLSDEEVTLGEKLRTAGYAPGGYVANWRLSTSLGYSQGFRRWWVRAEQGKVRGDELRDASLSWLRLPWPQPRFLYLHYMEPHAPYDPPEPFRSRFACPNLDRADTDGATRKALNQEWNELSRPDVDCLESLYDGEVASVDAELRKLFIGLQERGFLDNAIVVITADHGEEFFDHGGMLHGFTLYSEMVDVPLLFLGPGIAAGRIVNTPVSLVDVAPTVLALLGLPPEPRFEGRSLVGLMTGEGSAASVVPPDEDPILLQLEPEGSEIDMRRHVRGLVQGDVALLVGPHGGQQLYDLAKDPRETHPNQALDWVQPRSLSDVLNERMTALGQRAGMPAKREVLDEATREKLRALGYNQ